MASLCSATQSVTTSLNLLVISTLRQRETTGGGRREGDGLGQLEKWATRAWRSGHADARGVNAWMRAGEGVCKEQCRMEIMRMCMRGVRMQTQRRGDWCAHGEDFTARVASLRVRSLRYPSSGYV